MKKIFIIVASLVLPLGFTCYAMQGQQAAQGNQVENRENAEHMCAICFNSGSATTPMVPLHCKHEFHAECIKSWIDRRDAATSVPTCPMCRGNLKRYDVKTVNQLVQQRQQSTGIDLVSSFLIACRAGVLAYEALPREICAVAASVIAVIQIHKILRSMKSNSPTRRTNRFFTS